MPTTRRRAIPKPGVSSPSGSTTAEEWRHRLDAAARSAGVPAAPGPSLGFSTGPALYPPVMLPYMGAPVPPPGPAPSFPGPSGAGPAPAPAGRPETSNLAESLKELVKVVVEAFGAGMAGGRQVLGAVAGHWTAPWEPPGYGGCGCHAPSAPACCCGAVCCGAYPPDAGGCHMHGHPGCASCVRPG